MPRVQLYLNRAPWWRRWFDSRRSRTRPGEILIRDRDLGVTYEVNFEVCSNGDVVITNCCRHRPGRGRRTARRKEILQPRTYETEYSRAYIDFMLEA